MGARVNVFIFGVILSVIALWQVHLVFYGEHHRSALSWILSGWIAFLSGGCGVTLFHMSIQTCSKYTSTKELVILYFMGHVFKLFGAYKRRQFDNNSENPRSTQEKTLLYILRKNSKTEYGVKMGFGDIAGVDEFRERQPVSTYDQIQEYVERTARGEDNVLLPTRPVQLVLTSGTTGKPKMIPLSSERKLHLPLTGLSMMQNIMQQSSEIAISTTQKMCSVYTHPTEYWSEAGIVKSAFTRLTENDIPPTFSSPAAGFRIRNEKDAMYVHAVFALRDKTLACIQAPFCSFICNFFKLIESNWRDIVHDISTGAVKADLDIPDDVRRDLNAAMVSDPVRAQELKGEFERGFDGIATRVWPSMTCLFGVVAPAFQIYADQLETKYAKGVLLHSSFYIASEGLFGLNIWPSEREHRFHYLLTTDIIFFEFIPLENSHEDQPKTRLIDDVIQGESYELIITTIDGLYRFRFGDVIKVVGFYNKSPIIEFQFRKGDLINLRGEKISEDSLFRALTDIITSLEASLVDYSCAESHVVESVKGTSESTPYYVIFAEAKSNTDDEQKRLIDGGKFDSILRNQVEMYDYYRNMKALGPASVVFVQQGAFQALRSFMIDNSTTSPMQFKMPRKLRKKEWVEILLKYSSQVES